MMAGIMVFSPFSAYSDDGLRIKVVYNNAAFSDEMELDWGFSCRHTQYCAKSETTGT
jgi:hypothetical protein